MKKLSLSTLSGSIIGAASGYFLAPILWSYIVVDNFSFAFRLAWTPFAHLFLWAGCTYIGVEWAQYIGLKFEMLKEYVSSSKCHMRKEKKSAIIYKCILVAIGIVLYFPVGILIQRRMKLAIWMFIQGDTPLSLIQAIGLLLFVLLLTSILVYAFVKLIHNLCVAIWRKEIAKLRPHFSPTMVSNVVILLLLARDSYSGVRVFALHVLQQQSTIPLSDSQSRAEAEPVLSVEDSRRIFFDPSEQPSAWFSSDCSIAAYVSKDEKDDRELIVFSDGSRSKKYQKIVFGPIFNEDGSQYAFVAAKQTVTSLTIVTNQGEGPSFKDFDVLPYFTPHDQLVYVGRLHDDSEVLYVNSLQQAHYDDINSNFQPAHIFMTENEKILAFGGSRGDERFLVVGEQTEKGYSMKEMYKQIVKDNEYTAFGNVAVNEENTFVVNTIYSSKGSSLMINGKIQDTFGKDWREIRELLLAERTNAVGYVAEDSEGYFSVVWNEKLIGKFNGEAEIAINSNGTELAYSYYNVPRSFQLDYYVVHGWRTYGPYERVHDLQYIPNTNEIAFVFEMNDQSYTFFRGKIYGPHGRTVLLQVSPGGEIFAHLSTEDNASGFGVNNYNSFHPGYHSNSQALLVAGAAKRKSFNDAARSFYHIHFSPDAKSLHYCSFAENKLWKVREPVDPSISES
ncbi:MAG: hypothetical protein Q7R81_03055 [Candidatus Peregrinibacteria bacterium]|nr:hypothetical protein [Candidatus Peregrinibacteria bacterium]